MNHENSHGHGNLSSGAPLSGDFARMAEDSLLQGRRREAIDICRQGLEKIPDSLRIRLILGECYLGQGMIAEAKRELEKVAASIEECLSVYKLLGQVYLRENNKDDAIAGIGKVVRESSGGEKTPEELPSSEMAWLRQKIKTLSMRAEPNIREEGGVDQGVFPPEETERTLQTDTLAEIYSKQGHLEKALSIYEEILARQPGNIRVREKSAVLRKRMETQRRTALNRRIRLKMERWLAVVAPEKETLAP